MKRAAFFLVAALVLALPAPGQQEEGGRPERQPARRVEIWVPWGVYPGWPGWGQPPDVAEPGIGHSPGLMGIPYGWYPQCMDFLVDTREMRRRLLLKRFEYMEEKRKQEPSPRVLLRLEAEMGGLANEIYDLAPLECGGHY